MPRTKSRPQQQTLMRYRRAGALLTQITRMRDVPQSSLPTLSLYCCAHRPSTPRTDKRTDARQDHSVPARAAQHRQLAALPAPGRRGGPHKPSEEGEAGGGGRLYSSGVGLSAFPWDWSLSKRICTRTMSRHFVHKSLMHST